MELSQLNAEARRANAKSRFIDTIVQVRRDQLAGKLPMTEQANAANIAELESASSSLRNRRPAMSLTQQDRAYAEGSSRFAFAHARHYVEFKAAGDRKLASYHRREVVEIAKWLEDGLKKCAKRDGEV